MIEALISAAILAAIAAALAPTLYVAVRHSAKRADLREHGNALASARDALGQIFAAAAIVDSRFASDRFFGDEADMAFHIVLNMAEEPQRVALSIADGQLLLANNTEAVVAGVSDAALLEGVLGFRYFGTDEADAAPQWRERWDSPVPPTLIEIVLDQKKHPQSAPLQFQLSNRSPIQCEFDQVARQCRR